MKKNWMISILIMFSLLFIVFILFFLIPGKCENDFKIYPEKGYCEFNLKTCEGLFGCKEYKNVQVPCGSESTLCGGKVLCDCGDDNKAPLSYSADNIKDSNISDKTQDEGLVSENEIYFSNTNSEYPLVLNNRVYPINERPEISKELNDNDIKKLSLTPLMSVPDNSWIFNIGTAANTNDVYFVVYSSLAYQYTVHQNSDTLKNPSGGGVTVLTAYRYTPGTKTIERLFDTLDFPELVRKYPQIKSVSADGRYVAFDVTPCWGCGGGYPTTFLFDTVKKMRDSGKDIGRVLEFQWLDNGNYQYKEFIDRECEVLNTCYRDPANLPLINESL
jgi:hypothetical protein